MANRRRTSRSRHSRPLVALFRKVKRSIVYIRTVKGARPEIVPALPFLFPQEPESANALGIGTGFIVRRSGLILTSEHIVRHHRGITVRLHDGTLYPARLVWSDGDQDIALLAISPSRPLTPLRLGSSRRCQVGEPVIAVGHPLGLKNTVTTGIISACHRQLAFSDKTMDDILQTDCAINPGSSGGPLINLQGRAVGMNAFTAKDTHGLSFAVGMDGIVKRIRRYLV